MKKLISLFIVGLILLSCSKAEVVTIVITNPLSIDRNTEMVELPLEDVLTRLQIENSDFIIIDEQKKEIPYQITSNKKILFSANVPANGKASYILRKGTPVPVPTIVCGRQYPERVDDIAWENDLVAFRTYGPALQKTGERAFGYDVWTKRDTKEPVVEDRYAKDLNPDIDYSYHVDYGNGLDCYKVGPTLGGGTAALMVDGNIIYPYCYKEYEILDNGPLRFTLKLSYNPLLVKENSEVIETRIITLDAGSHLNKTTVTYSGLSEISDIVTGIVLHEPEEVAHIVANKEHAYMSYIDPTDNPRVNNGKIFIGAVFSKIPKDIKPLYFSKEEAQTERGGANGHLLAISDYVPETEYNYYWGSAWSKAGMTPEGWDEYLNTFSQKLQNPLIINWDPVE